METLDLLLPGGMEDGAYISRLGAQTLRHNPTIDQAWNHLLTAKSIRGESLDWSACSAGMRVTAGRSPLLGESA